LTLDFTYFIIPIRKGEDIVIRRQAEESLLRLASQFMVVAITGPRQSGKTTLAQSVFPGKQYVSFDDINMRELAASNPRDFLLAFPNGVIIDEVQKVPEIFDAIKIFVDEGPYTPGKYIITGSSQFNLKESITESLAGRIGLIKLLPFSLSELKSEGLLQDSAYHTLFKGFYPPLHDRNKHFIPEDWFQNYVETYINMDIRGQINPANISTFRKFLQMCALYSGQLINMESISREIGISAVTVKSWLSILEESFIIHFLEPDTNNLGRSLVKTPKLYFVDSGLMCYLLRLENAEELILSRHKGAAVETIAVSEILKSRYNAGKSANLTFFRDRTGFEIDTIADWKHTFAIEIKSNSTTEKNFSKNTRKYIKARGDETKGAIFYLGDVSMEINDISYVSWKDWGDFSMQ
jgi:predicted AAA+ superfamily ATPase